MKLLAIDPGPVTSGVALIETCENPPRVEWTERAARAKEEAGPTDDYIKQLIAKRNALKDELRRFVEASSKCPSCGSIERRCVGCGRTLEELMPDNTFETRE